VQEGLANALTHANCARADVTVRYGGDGVEVEIADDCSSVNGSGRPEGESVAGMRARVALYGGTLETGPRDGDGGGYVVRAQLPLEGTS
jgi:signal transduction histidine kinase